MSWSRGFAGTPEQCAAQARLWAEEQRFHDVHLVEPAQKAHQAQIAACAEALETFATGTPPSMLLTGSAHGHANSDGSGQFGLSATYHRNT